MVVAVRSFFGIGGRQMRCGWGRGGIAGRRARGVAGRRGALLARLADGVAAGLVWRGRMDRGLQAVARGDRATGCAGGWTGNGAGIAAARCAAAANSAPMAARLAASLRSPKRARAANGERNQLRRRSSSICAAMIPQIPSMMARSCAVRASLVTDYVYHQGNRMSRTFAGKFAVLWFIFCVDGCSGRDGRAAR